MFILVCPLRKKEAPISTSKPWSDEDLPYKQKIREYIPALSFFHYLEAKQPNNLWSQLLSFVFANNKLNLFIWSDKSDNDSTTFTLLKHFMNKNE